LGFSNFLVNYYFNLHHYWLSFEFIMMIIFSLSKFDLKEFNYQ